MHKVEYIGAPSFAILGRRYQSAFRTRVGVTSRRLTFASELNPQTYLRIAFCFPFGQEPDLIGDLSRWKSFVFVRSEVPEEAKNWLREYLLASDEIARVLDRARLLTRS